MSAQIAWSAEFVRAPSDADVAPGPAPVGFQDCGDVGTRIDDGVGHACDRGRVTELDGVR